MIKNINLNLNVLTEFDPKVKAVTKIREYFLLKINQFKKPLANYQIPQNAMLRLETCQLAFVSIVKS